MQRKNVFLVIFCCSFASPDLGFAASFSDMKKDCVYIARTMMEKPKTFKYIDASRASKDNNQGVAIRFTGTRDNILAKLSCFFVRGKISKLHLKATEINGRKIDKYLAGFLLRHVKDDLTSRR